MDNRPRPAMLSLWAINSSRYWPVPRHGAKSPTNWGGVCCLKKKSSWLDIAKRRIFNFINIIGNILRSLQKVIRSGRWHQSQPSKPLIYTPMPQILFTRHALCIFYSKHVGYWTYCSQKLTFNLFRLDFHMFNFAPVLSCLVLVPSDAFHKIVKGTRWCRT